MTQTLQVTVPIPDTHVIVSKVEYQELIDNQPMNMTLEEVAKYYRVTKKYIVEHIIDDDYFKRKIEPFSTFLTPNGGGKYLFNRKRMKQFLDEYDEEIKARVKKKN
ncbi:DUF771 domain-containing protein [Staphylococcus saprophyticus]|uniref:DUF771 domain-containing protein n=1 Tax=Staphylococcus saprophyticus TaxID=29385 RepID=UPI00085326A7|nr:DUF771 domain-containing protein [Staphylococcus saprophyticus]MDW3933572.1 DUF771 domain-containing protein [Staphylococcus saprophyticus]OEK18833.1 hypothetical protein ASS81_11295 [Staphylococcus saprophyticus]